MANEKRLIDANALKANFVVLGEFAKDLWHAGTIRGAIDNAPTVDAVEVVHGKWVKDEKASENHIEAIYVCSACQNCEAWGETEKTNYCPNCGADMRERKDNDL